MKVVVSVPGRYHGFDLARELERLGALERLITSYPHFQAKKFGIDPESVTSLLPCELYKRTLEGIAKQRAAAFEPSINALFERLAALALPNELDVFVGWAGFSLRALKRARATGALGVIECGSGGHIEFQEELMREECELHGVEPKSRPSSIVRRELAEYQEADAIAVTSTFALQTFVKRGFSAEKLIVNPLGVDLTGFTPAEEPPDKFRILFVGPVSLRRGTHYLLKAFDELKLPGSELVLIGPVEPEFEPFRERYSRPNVYFLGSKPHAELPKYYRRASVFVQPSIQEGAAAAMFEAMACGLPLILTPNTGGRALIEEGQNGYVVPIRDTKALRSRLEELYALGDKIVPMGRHNAEIVAEGYTWRDYGRRAKSAYLERLSRPGSGGVVLRSRRPGLEDSMRGKQWNATEPDTDPDTDSKEQPDIAG